MFIGFTDGSLTGAGTKYTYGSFGYILTDENYKQIHQSVKTETDTTISRMELEAVISLLEYVISINKIKTKPTIIIYSDSMYVINSFNIWISKWKKNGWVSNKGTPIANKDLMLTLDKLKSKVQCHFIHIKSHSNHYTDIKVLYNSKIDSMVKQAVYDLMIKEVNV